jgi:hypothetical protein
MIISFFILFSFYRITRWDVSIQSKVHSKEEMHLRSRIRPDRVNVAKRVDEPEQNYNEWMAGGWSKLLTSEPAVVAGHQTWTRAC